MKESELMKFDWVMFDKENYEPYEISRIYMQVDHFNCGAVYGTYIAHCEEDSLYNSRKYGKVMPVPITPDLLEKNGFENNGYGDYILNKEDYLVGCSIIHRTIRVIISNEFNYAAKDVFIPCEDVHKLQHALRLCGLNELADNLKLK